MNRRSSIRPRDLVTIDIVPGLWYVTSLAPEPGTYYLTGRDDISRSLCALLPYGTLVRTSQQLRHYTVTDNQQE